MMTTSSKLVARRGETFLVFVGFAFVMLIAVVVWNSSRAKAGSQYAYMGDEVKLQYCQKDVLDLDTPAKANALVDLFRRLKDFPTANEENLSEQLRRVLHTCDNGCNVQEWCSGYDIQLGSLSKCLDDYQKHEDLLRLVEKETEKLKITGEVINSFRDLMSGDQHLEGTLRALQTYSEFLTEKFCRR